ncbi:MAG: rSAM/selenodomain-associated transferase 1 [Lysobacterales bacterium]|jgi:rSAM/selenodomain-associated transferase 1
MNKNALVIFAREPELGCVKTRLAKDLGDELTLRLYKAFVKDVTYIVQTLVDVDLYIYYVGLESPVMFLQEFSQSFILRKQNGSDLGARMKDAFDCLFGEGYEKVLLVGTDCITFSKEDLSTAFDQLNTNDCVLGPTFDGGYYLIALKEMKDILFEDIPWSTECVFDMTQKYLLNMNQSTYLLDPKDDIDDIKTLRVVQKKLNFKVNMTHSTQILDKLQL